MLKRAFFIPTLLSLGCFLVAGSGAQAQHGGGHGGGGHGGGGHGGGGMHMGGAHYGGGGGRSFGGFYGGYGGLGYGGLGYGGLGYGGLGYGGYYGGGGGLGYGGYYGGGGGMYYNSPYYYPNNYYSTPQFSDYYQPAPQSFTPPAPISNASSIRVLVPNDQAKVFFDGNATKQTGGDRLFNTPELDPNGGPYTYRIRASWTQNNQEVVQERVVEVTPGQVAVADFR